MGDIPSSSVAGHCDSGSIPADYKPCNGSNSTPNLANWTSPCTVKWMSPDGGGSGGPCPGRTDTIVQFNSTNYTLAENWLVCDGNNGTPELPAETFQDSNNDDIEVVWIIATKNNLNIPAGSIVRIDDNESTPEGWQDCDGSNATPDIPDEITTGDVTKLRYIELTS